MIKNILTTYLLLLYVLYAFVAYAEWRGYVKQSYQKRGQYFNPTEVKPWLSDAVSSATRLVAEEGPVTEIESLWDIEIPRASLTAGVFGRLLWYSEAAYHYMFSPWVHYQNKFNALRLGREQIAGWGSGLLLSDFSTSGISYDYYGAGMQTEVFYYAALERSAFQRDVIRYGGISEILNFDRGKVGLLYAYDDSAEFDDASRAAVSNGSGISAQGSWEWNNDWYAQGEVVYAGNWGLFAGLDIPLLSFLSLQTRLRFMDAGFNPLLGRYAREGDKQTHMSVRFPLDFLSEQLIIRPQWGIKHTSGEDYWLPGLTVEFTIADMFWIRGVLLGEQPFSTWGALEHYEYTELKLAWMLTGSLFLDIQWRKTFNGFLAWKEVQTLYSLEWQW